ncbi:MAG: hypothetical protein NZM00_02030, partial [Anaerolinea sp.]|nr:hypothetical protein [Anaerolinea sp.]
TATWTPPARTTISASPTTGRIAMPVERDAEIELVYDELTFILHNISADEVDISGWRFVQSLPNGGTRAFDSSFWEGGSRPIYALPANDCFQAWDILTVGQLPVPEICGARHAWRAIAPQRQFWISPSRDPAAVFEVQAADGRVLARCPISAGRCLLDLDRLNEP